MGPPHATPPHGPKPEATPLEALLRAANRGDQRAYAEFLRTITPLVRGVARARGPGSRRT